MKGRRTPARKAGQQRPARSTRPAALARAQPAAAGTEDDALVPRLADPAATMADPLARLRSLETLEDGYQAWVELRGLYARAQALFAEERARIEDQGEFLLGAVRAARDQGRAGAGSGAALAPAGSVDAFIAQTSARLDAARAQLEAEVRAAQTRWAAALAEARATVTGRVERTLAHSRPALRLVLRTLPQGRRILHLERLAGDAPVLVHAVLGGAVPSRHGFLFDDSTDEVSLAPACLYAEEGVAGPEVRAGPSRVRALLEAAGGVFPSKGMIPMRVPQPATTLLARFLQRGPVAEAEVADGEQWRGMLSVDEAEQLAGWLIKLQLEGRLTVTLVRG